MVILLLITKSATLDLVSSSIKAVVQIWGHLSKVQFKD